MPENDEIVCEERCGRIVNHASRPTIAQSLAEYVKLTFAGLDPIYLNG